MNVGIVGLGLIGGSLARSYSSKGKQVYGFDTDKVVLDFAKLSGAVYGTLDETTVQACDLIFLAVFPDAAIQWLTEMAPRLSSQNIVIDCCGTKRKICAAGFALAEQYGFPYLGGHPMAGTQYRGFAHSRADLYEGQSMILVPPEHADMALLERVKELLSPAGFGSITMASAEHHDEMIAYTSQMAHVASNAFVKSPRAQSHKGYSAGSYKDLTRVAWLNEDMWTTLFLENRDFLLEEIRLMQKHLEEYAQAMEHNDPDRLRALLAEGRLCKEKVDAV